MKMVFKVCLNVTICIFLLGSLESINAQWADSTTFKQEIAVIPQISKIKFSSDGKEIMTYSTDNTLRYWDASSGNLIKANSDKFASIVDLDDENKYTAVITDNSFNKCTLSIFYNISDSLKYSIDLTSNKFEYGVGKYNFTSNKVIVSKKYNLLIVFVTQIFDGWYHKEFGFIEFYNLETGTLIKSFDNIMLRDITISKDNIYLAIVGLKTSYIVSAGTSTLDNFLIIYKLEDLTENIIPLAQTPSDIPIRCDFSYDCKYIGICNYDNSILIYDLINKKTHRKIPNEYKPPKDENLTDDIVFSKNNYDFFTSSKTQTFDWQYQYRIRKWNIELPQVVDSIVYPWNSERWLLDISSNSNTLLAGSNMGRIRLWDLSCFKVSPQPNSVAEYNYATSIRLSPNPATDFIEIFAGVQHAELIQNKVGIYDVFGQIQTTPSLRDTPPYQGGEKVKIDISGLAPGVYFVRVGDKVSKFVKV